MERGGCRRRQLTFLSEREGFGLSHSHYLFIAVQKVGSIHIELKSILLYNDSSSLQPHERLPSP